MLKKLQTYPYSALEVGLDVKGHNYLEKEYRRKTANRQVLACKEANSKTLTEYYPLALPFFTTNFSFFLIVIIAIIVFICELKL